MNIFLFIASNNMEDSLKNAQEWLREFMYTKQFFLSILIAVPILILSFYIIKIIWDKFLLNKNFKFQTWGLEESFAWILTYFLFINLLFGFVRFFLPENFYVETAEYNETTYLFKILFSWVSNFIILGIIFLIYFDKRAKRIFKIKFRHILVSIVSYFLFLPWYLASYFLSHLFLALINYTPEPQKVALDILSSKGLAFLIGALGAVVFAPIFEEFLFRGFIHTGFRKIGKYKAILLSAFIFAVLHMNLLAFFPIFVLGIFFALLYERTNSLWAPILAHACHNGIVLFYISTKF